MSPAHNDTYHFSGFELDVNMRLLARDGQRVALGPKAYQVLTCLVQRAGQVVSKADLIKEVWANSYVEEGTLTQHIFSLRKALGDKADCIVTVPGHGYRFDGLVKRGLAGRPTMWPANDGNGFLHEVRERTHVVVEEPVLPAHVLARPASARLRSYVMAACGLVLTVVLCGWLWWHRAPPVDHVAVVLSDFTNTTGDAAFDQTLLRALQIDLEQSPYVDVMGDKEGAATLKMMGRPDDTQLTPAIASEICVRTNRHVLLTGNISRIGDRYLLTLEATDCNTGKRLASAKEQADNRNVVLASLDLIAERVRSKLGESASSIQAYEVPISQATTSSLEALKAYSTVTYLTNHGTGLTDEQRLPFYKKAVELDPQFALAWVGISNCYYQLLEPNVAAIYMQKAFDLRDRVTAKEKLVIEAHYYSDVDMLKSLETYRVWATTYPRESVPWTNMTNIYNELGLYPEAVVAGRKAWEMSPVLVNAALLIRAYKNEGRFAEAKELADLRRRTMKNHNGWDDSLLMIAFYEHDKPAFEREVQLGKDGGNDLWNYHQAIPASMEGKYKEAEDFFASEVRKDEQANLGEVKDGVLVDEAEVERTYGFPAQARSTLARMTKGSVDMPDVAYEHAQEGDTAWVERYLALHGNDPHPPGSFLGFLWFPLLHSEMALRHGQLQEALTALDAGKQNDLKGTLLRMQRAKVYMALHQPDMAAQIYKNVLATPGSGFGINYPMAHLGLARAYAAEGNAAASRAEYQSFFSAWKDGDQDLPVLKIAREEWARLS